MLRAVAVHVIDGQFVRGAAAGAGPAVVVEYLRLLAVPAAEPLGAAQSPVPLGVAVTPPLPAFLAG